MKKKKVIITQEKNRRVVVFDIVERRMDYETFREKSKKIGEKMLNSERCERLGEQISDLLREINKEKEVYTRYNLYTMLLATLDERIHIPNYLKDDALRRCQEFGDELDMMGQFGSVMGEKKKVEYIG